jgi:RimJ/RimL family protein N-acetyltransferase
MDSILDLIKCIKENQNFRIDVPGTSAYLRLAHADLFDARCMAKWRTLHYQQFLTWIKPTSEQLLFWLNSNVPRNDDMMLILESEEGIRLGQMSLYHIDAENKQAEFGRVIRGVADFRKEIMIKASEALLAWAFNELRLLEIYLEVFEMNHRAKRFYKKLGFCAENTYQVVKQFEDGVVRWIKEEQLTCSLSGRDTEFRRLDKMVLRRN